MHVPPESHRDQTSAAAQKELEQEVRTRLTEFLLRRREGFREIHNLGLERDFQARARSIYGLDRYSFAGVDVDVSAVYECEDGSMMALIHVRDHDGFDVYPDLRCDVLFEYAVRPDKPGVILEPLLTANQATLVARDGDPRKAKLLPFFSDQAFEELEQHRSLAVSRLKMLRAVDHTSCYPVGEASLLVHMMLRTIRDELGTGFLGDPRLRDLYSLPTAVRDIEQRDPGVYDIRIGRLRVDDDANRIPIESGDEIHRVALVFNRFFGNVERRYLGLQKSA